MDGQNFNEENFNNQAAETVVTEATAKPGNGLAIGGLICGIAGIVLSCCYCGFLGIPGLIMGIIANKKNKSGLALAAIITSVIALVIFVIYLICSVIFGAGFISAMNESYYYY